MTTTPKLSHKDAALAAIALALTKVEALPPSPERRYCVADLETARDELSLLQELKRPRKAEVKKRDQNPRDVAILGGGPAL